MKTAVRVEGLRDLERALAELGDEKVRRASARRAARRALEPMAEIARRLVPVATGNLAASIRVGARVSGTSADRQAFANVMRSGGTRDEAVAAMRDVRRAGSTLIELHMGPGRHPQAIMQEFGTQHHPAQPFMRPAWDQDSLAALERMKDQLWADIQRTARRNAARAARLAAQGG